MYPPVSIDRIRVSDGEKYQYARTAHIIKKIIKNVQSTSFMTLLINIFTLPRPSKKDGNRQADGGGQVPHTGSLAGNEGIRELEWERGLDGEVFSDDLLSHKS